MIDDMQTYPHLTKAPVIEAVIDIRVKLPDDFDMSAFLPLRQRLKEKYPQVQEVSDFHLTTEWRVGTEPRASTETGRVRIHLFRSEDGTQVIQFGREGFSFSRLSPYTSWDEVFHEAWDLWVLYAEIARPLEISRLAVRYINRLPFPGTQLSIYLRAPSMRAEGWPSNIATFLSRIVLIEGETVINVVQLLEPVTEPGQSAFPMIFDIDTYQDIALQPGDVTVLDRFAKLREMKNRIFFKGLTEAALDLFR